MLLMKNQTAALALLIQRQRLTPTGTLLKTQLKKVERFFLEVSTRNYQQFSGEK